MGLLFPHRRINRDLNQTGHTEWQCEVVQLFERCPIYDQPWSNGMKAYICFNSGMNGTLWEDDLEWYDRWMIQPGWDRELAWHVEKPSEAGSGHPLRTCTAKMKGLSVGAAASNSRFLLHPFHHPPLSLHFSLWLSWLSPQYDIVLLLHVYPVAMVTPCRRCTAR